jgi:hypothetical protein
MTPSVGFARPIPRAAQPQFMSLDSYQMTLGLIAEIDEAHSLGAGAGMSGVAYAGGASSGPVSRSTQLEPGSLPNESTLERLRSGERPSPREPTSGSATLQRRDTARDKDRESWERDREVRRRGSVKRDAPPTMPTQRPSPKSELERTDSSLYFSALSTSGEHSASYGQQDRELRSAQAATSRRALPHLIRMCRIWNHCAQRRLPSSTHTACFSLITSLAQSSRTTRWCVQPRKPRATVRWTSCSCRS